MQEAVQGNCARRIRRHHVNGRSRLLLDVLFAAALVNGERVQYPTRLNHTVGGFCVSQSGFS